MKFKKMYNSVKILIFYRACRSYYFTAGIREELLRTLKMLELSDEKDSLFFLHYSRIIIDMAS
jgi:hypothetical protein